MLSAEMSTARKIYYAPAASTCGDKVKIYRYAFDYTSQEYRRKIEAESHPLRKALLRHEWSQFIMRHINDYAGDRDSMARLAKTLATTALLDAEQIIRKAENNLKRACDTLRKAEKKYGLQKTATGEDVCSKGLTATAKREIEALKYDVKIFHKRVDELRQICPAYRLEQIRQSVSIHEHHTRQESLSRNHKMKNRQNHE